MARRTTRCQSRERFRSWHTGYGTGVASIPAPPVPLSQVGRAAHDVGLAGLLGGNLFGRLALHPSVTEISDKTERGKLVNAAWHRYGIINSLSLGAVVAGWLGARGKEAAPNQLSEAERRLAVAKDVLVGVVAVTGAVTAAEGVRFSRQAPGGAVPLDDGDHTAAEASEAQHRAKARLNALGLASLAADLALVGVNAALAQEGFRRPPRRRIRRWRD
ncbi:MAG: hypothetical protein ACJ76T_13045 [Solirubrobacteraceae bacterium]